MRGRGVLFGNRWAGVEDCAEGVKGKEEGSLGWDGACLEGHFWNWGVGGDALREMEIGDLILSILFWGLGLRLD